MPAQRLPLGTTVAIRQKEHWPVVVMSRLFLNENASQAEFSFGRKKCLLITIALTHKSRARGQAAAERIFLPSPPSHHIRSAVVTTGSVLSLPVGMCSN